MQYLKKVFDFYIQSSIHVAVAVYALVRMTYHMFLIPQDLYMEGFAFFGTIFGYNFVKYESLFRLKKVIRKQLQAILALSILSLLLSTYCFFKLQWDTQWVAVVFFGLTFLYTVPVFSNKQNIRNWKGVKIYIVAFCWAGVTTLLPLVNSETAITTDFFLKFGQRFLLVIILILVFEIIDSKNDDPSLMTVPQKIGVHNTKILGVLLLIPFFFLEFLRIHIDQDQLWINLILVVVTALFTLCATPDRSKYYTSFWVESIPIFWLGMVVFIEPIKNLF
ncbi:hypothetical protein [Flavobacterium sp. '19STA2R22 D10 B1']|uniref:hypothetical protein n=1 Tax=Flavobacterium aerium TaxID=3037261 RepID=UPI00278C5E80|nr:hypothetical protein [Flavobacterium sp. '19STA2R22 D10 B1']